MTDSGSSRSGLRSGDRLGPYEIVGAIGAGGMGQVYEARDPRLNRRVAIKILPEDRAMDPVARSRFDREAKAIAALNHRHICAIYDVGQQGSTDYLVMERLDGQTLSERLRRGPLPVPAAIQMAIEVADALDKAHRAGIVHRDLKPGNIMLTKEGSKLLDFGLAKARSVGDEATLTIPREEITADGAVLGTVQYMAPEQLEGRDADTRTDLFAFGAVVHEMVTGTKAFPGRSQASVISAIMQAEPAPLVPGIGVTPALDRTIRKCLAKDPDDRWQTARDLRDELRWLAQPASIEPPTTTTQPRPISRAIAPVLAALVAIASTWAIMRVRDRPVRPEDRIAFTIPPPEGVTWGVTPPEPQPALSPDGRKLAFVGDTAEGHGVWIRDIGSTEAQLVAGSMDDGGPRAGLFWSPDSTRLGYCRGGRLVINPLGGGAVKSFDSGCLGGSASWNQAGQILFRGADGIYLIADQGGRPTRLTTADSSLETVHNFPRWLPDGRRFIYTVIASDSASAGIFASAAEGGTPTRVLSDVSKSEIVQGPGGVSYLLFVRDRRLMLQTIELSTLAPVGEATVLAERVGIGNVAMPSFTVTATVLVHRSGGTNPPSTWEWRDRHGQPVGGRIAGRSPSSSAALSPDDSVFVYASTTATSVNGPLWKVDFNSRVEQQLFSDPGGGYLPAFARDGRRIAFAWIEPGERRLYMMDFPGGRPVRLATSPTLGLLPSDWTLDGRAILGTTSLGDLAVVPIASPDKPVTIVENASQPRFSPDGQWLAFTSAKSGTAEVYVQRYPDGGDHQRVSGSGGTQPRWRADGAELYYLTMDGTLMAVPVRTTPRFEHRTAARLFRELLVRGGSQAFDHVYLASRDGQRFLVNVPTGGPVPLTAIRNWLPATP